MIAESITGKLARTPRQKRSILLGARKTGTEIEQELRVLAAELDLALHVCTTLPELSLWLDKYGEALCLVVLDGDFPDVVSAARTAVANSPWCELLFVATREQQREIERKFGPAPRIGTHWQFLAPGSSELVRAAQSAYQRAAQRRSVRTTLDRFNAVLTPPSAAVDTHELRQLVLSDRFLSSILESAFDGVILVDRGGAMVAFNPSAERIFGRTQKEALSRPIRSLAEGAWPTDIGGILSRPRDPKMVQSSFVTGNSTVHVEVSATPVFDRNGNVMATSMIIRNVTERLMAEQALRTTEKLSAVGRLASSIAHEINNPLESITNLLYLAREHSENPQVQQFLDMAQQELQRVSVIANQTLQFHKQATKPREVTIDTLFAGVLAIYHNRMINSHVRLERREGSSQPVLCFEGEIRQVLNNLVGNAIDAMSPAGGRLVIRSRVGTNWSSGEKGMVMTVADTGGGMDRVTLKKIFEPFFTTKGIGGTGLGLWVSSEIVERHRGVLRARSSQRPGRSGTVFTLFLPFDAATR